MEQKLPQLFSALMFRAANINAGSCTTDLIEAVGGCPASVLHCRLVTLFLLGGVVAGTRMHCNKELILALHHVHLRDKQSN